MRMWQRAMIALAGHERLARWMHACRWTATLALRFVSGGSGTAAWRAVAALRAQGALASLYYLGEYVTSLALVARNVEEILATIERGDPTRRARPSASAWEHS
ncbi:MAG: hypothetical protein JXP37_07685 [Coriobacteriia bacterium]|nr:hypothetical protein [Coriobacteriia bacterium]